MPDLRLVDQASGVMNPKPTQVRLIAVLCLLFIASLPAHGGQALPGQPALVPVVSDIAEAVLPATDDTNSPVAQIRADLEKVKRKIDASVKDMEQAVASTATEHADRVSRLATQIREIATKDIGDDGRLIKGAEALLGKMRESVAEARAKASAPNIRKRDMYAKVLRRLETELHKLEEARASVERIRSELIAQADALSGDAEAIGFAAHANDIITASEGFRNTLSEVVEWTRHLELLIHQVGESKIVAAS